MTTEINEQTGPRVTVNLTRSSQKDGKSGYSITVSENATQEEAKRVMKLALELRMQAEAALNGPPLSEQLEQSVKALPEDD